MVVAYAFIPSICEAEAGGFKIKASLANIVCFRTARTTQTETKQDKNKQKKQTTKMIERIKHAHLENQDHCFHSCGTIPD